MAGRRGKYKKETPFGSDSFLDVVANLVGVLIILIVLVGLRIVDAPPSVFLESASAEVSRKLAGLEAGLGDLIGNREQLAEEMHDLRRSLDQNDSKARALELEYVKRWSQAEELSAAVERSSQHAENTARSLDNSQQRLLDLARQVQDMGANLPEPRELVHRTPLSQPVNSQELHLRLMAGKVSFVDIQTLFQEAQGKFREMEQELRNRGKAVGLAGPVDGYMLNFTMMREDPSFAQSLMYRNGGFRARLVQWHIIASGSPPQETIVQALAANSRLRQLLASHGSKQYTLTLWTYPDSFDAYRQLRDWLYDQGYSVAARPLPFGNPIAGSIYGTRSLVQ